MTDKEEKEFISNPVEAYENVVKQLARKTQECEQLKKECEKYKQALFEIKIYCKTALCVSISKNDINFIQMIIDIIDKAMRPK